MVRPFFTLKIQHINFCTLPHNVSMQSTHDGALGPFCSISEKQQETAMQKLETNTNFNCFNYKIQIQRYGMFNKASMEYKKLGNTGLMVSILGYGNYNSHELIPFEQQVNIIKTCFQNGINFLDTAELYTEGKDEEDLGKILKQLKQPRQNYVITTKIWGSPDRSVNSKQGTSRKHIKQSIKGSLKRLQLDYVDLVMAHSYDEESPMEQICRAFHQVIQQGLSFYWGTSNWDADKVYEAMQVCIKNNLHKPVAIENQYNMINRKQIEEEYRTLFEKYHLGLIAYSPLMGGYLTGKYLDSKQTQGRLGSEMTGAYSKKQSQFRWFHNMDFEKTDKSLRQLKEIAEKQLNCNLTALAIAWVLKFPYSSTTLLGARDAEQLEECLKSFEIYKKLNKEIEGKINKILDTHPTARIEWKSFTQQSHLRPLSQ